MKVFVAKANEIKGENNGKQYHFVDTVVIYEDGKHANRFKINKSACEELEKIKAGAYFQMYLSPDELSVMVFNCIKEAPKASDDNVEGVKVDASTGEVLEEKQKENNKAEVNNKPGK
ncbi:MAG: hypothetical protein IJZ93_01115 [Clostridia bacterium]|nr:hypothetical protein [Clostridia bacterium]